MTTLREELEAWLGRLDNTDVAPALGQRPLEDILADVERLEQWLLVTSAETFLVKVEQAAKAQERWEKLKSELQFNGRRRRMPFLVAETYAELQQRMAQLEEGVKD